MMLLQQNTQLNMRGIWKYIHTMARGSNTFSIENGTQTDSIKKSLDHMHFLLAENAEFLEIESTHTKRDEVPGMLGTIHK